MLAEIGDCRARFPTPESSASLAGVIPVDPAVREDEDDLVRWSADNQLRDAVCDFAADSHHANPWAAHLYNQLEPAGTVTRMPSGSSPAPGCT